MALAANQMERSQTGQFMRLDKVIGIGTSKTVYEGIDTRNGTKVAWSKLEVDKSVEDFELWVEKCCQQAERLRSLNHRNILKCYSYWYDGTHINIISELCSSGNLRDYILKHDLFDCSDAIKNWCHQILKALLHIHNHDIIHLDVNLSNVFVNGNSGLVKLAEPYNAYNKALPDTPEYMARELFYRSDVCNLADIHSFGMTVLQMVTYDKIYGEYDSVDDIEEAVKNGVMPAALEQVSHPELRRFIGRCVQRWSRRPSAKTLLDDRFLATTEDDVEEDQTEHERIRLGRFFVSLTTMRNRDTL